MDENTKNGATLQELPEKSPISRKRKRKLLLEIEKKESKKLNRAQNLPQSMSHNNSQMFETNSSFHVK